MFHLSQVKNHRLTSNLLINLCHQLPWLPVPCNNEFSKKRQISLNNSNDHLGLPNVKWQPKLWPNYSALLRLMADNVCCIYQNSCKYQTTATDTRMVFRRNRSTVGNSSFLYSQLPKLDKNSWTHSRNIIEPLIFKFSRVLRNHALVAQVGLLSRCAYRFRAA